MGREGLSWRCQAYMCDKCPGYSWTGTKPRVPDWCQHWCHYGDPDRGL